MLCMLTTGLVVLGLDQLVKFIIRSRLVYGDSIPVIDGFFNIVYVRNTGAAWGMLRDHTEWLTLLAAAVAVLILVFHRRLMSEVPGRCFILGLLLGGVLGNLADRVRFGWVTDFLDFHWGRSHFPAFNVADSAICIAMMLYLFLSFQADRRAAAGKKS